MQVEDLTMQVIRLEAKLTDIELNNRDHNLKIQEKDKMIKIRDLKIAEEQENVSSEKSRVIINQ